MKGFSLQTFIVALLLPFVAGGIGSYFTTPALNVWYMELAKPPFNPPNIVFGPVWTILYLLQGIAFYTVLRSKAKAADKNYASVLFVIQLVLNTLWSIAFFGYRNPELGVGVIIMLLVFILLTKRAFDKISKNAGYLFIPYIAWVSFATVLNIAIAVLN